MAGVSVKVVKVQEASLPGPRRQSPILMLECGHWRRHNGPLVRVPERVTCTFCYATKPMREVALVPRRYYTKRQASPRSRAR